MSCHVFSGREGSLAAREDALWQRQQELWDRDTARWEAQRRASATREASLVEENAALRGQLLQLLSSLSGSRSTALEPATQSKTDVSSAVLPVPEDLSSSAAIFEAREKSERSSTDDSASPSVPMSAWSAQLHVRPT